MLNYLTMKTDREVQIQYKAQGKDWRIPLIKDEDMLCVLNNLVESNKLQFKLYNILQCQNLLQLILHMNLIDLLCGIITKCLFSN